jgi:two-component system NtrC family sensor kinase
MVVAEPASLLTTLMDSLPMAAALVDSEMTYLAVNRYWLRLVAIAPGTPPSLIGQSHRHYFPDHGLRWPHIYQACARDPSYQWQDDRPGPVQGPLCWTARRWVNPNLSGTGEQQEGILLLADEMTSCPLPEARSPWQLHKEQIIHTLSSQIHQTLDLTSILQTTVQSVRQLLDTDRVVIYKFAPDWSGSVVVESVTEGCPSILDCQVHDPCFSEKYVEPYRHGRIHVVPDVQRSNLLPCYVDFLAQLQVRANLVAPIVCNNQLWGLICIHECRSTRLWQPMEKNLVDQLSTHVGIAIQQAELYQTLQVQLAEQEETLERAIADRFSKEAALRRSEQRRSLLFEQTPIAVIETDRQLKITAWNRAAERLFGYSVEEAVGQYIHTLIVPSQEHPFVVDVMMALMENGSSYQTENLNVTKSGQEILCEWHDVRLVDESGELVGIASLAIDITQRKQAERALRQSETALRNQAQQLEQMVQELKRTQMQLVQSEKMSSLGLLVAGMAHEINNPVNFISGNVTYAHDYLENLLEILHLYRTHYPTPNPAIQEAIERVDLDYILEDFPKLLESMQVGTQRIRQIVTSLRSFSRTDETALKLSDPHTGLDSTLMILSSRLRQNADQAAITVEKRYGDLPPVECFPGPLNQVFMNILSNAIDALEEQRSLPNATPTISITTEQSADDWVQVRIADNGPGIPSHLHHRIFDPFFTTKEPGKGTGLGLSICYQIITERHHGRVRCISEGDGGTEFVIELPIVQLR